MRIPDTEDISAHAAPQVPQLLAASHPAQGSALSLTWSLITCAAPFVAAADGRRNRIPCRRCIRVRVIILPLHEQDAVMNPDRLVVRFQIGLDDELPGMCFGKKDANNIFLNVFIPEH